MTEEINENNQNYEDLVERLKQMRPEDIREALDIPSSQYDELFEDQQKLTTAPHEILIKINANVLEQNEKGEYIGSKGMFEQNYHIPVPTGTLYTNYVDAFFGFAKQALIDTINKTETETSTTTENTKDA